MTNFNIYAAEAGAINLQAKMSGKCPLEIFNKSDWSVENKGVYRRWVGFYLNKIIESNKAQVEFDTKCESERQAKWDALSPDRQAAIIARQKEYNEYSANLAATGKVRKRKLYKMRRILDVKYPLGVVFND